MNLGLILVSSDLHHGHNVANVVKILVKILVFVLQLR